MTDRGTGGLAGHCPGEGGLFTDEELIGPQSHQLDLFEPAADIEGDTVSTTTPEEAIVSQHKVGVGIRYHGSQRLAHGEGYITAVGADGRLTIRVHRPTQPDAWRPRGFVVRNVRPESVTIITACVDYGDEPGVIDLFGTGQLALAGV